MTFPFSSVILEPVYWGIYAWQRTCRNVISIKVLFLLFGLLCCFKKKRILYGLVKAHNRIVFTYFQSTKLYYFCPQISASGLFLKYSRKFSKFHPRYSYKLYSYKQEIEREYCPCSSAGEISLIKEVILNLYHHYVL